jgi:RsiW-degrading membrane proteinase PrsW (M82 family)
MITGVQMLYIITSLLMLYLIYNINTLGYNVFSSLFHSPTAVAVFSSVILAPIVEEYGKRFAVKRNFILIFAIIFGFGELLHYMSQGVAFADRLSVVFVHFTLAYVQKTFHDKSIEENNEWISKFGFLGAILIHSFYNLSAIVAV